MSLDQRALVGRALLVRVITPQEAAELQRLDAARRAAQRDFEHRIVYLYLCGRVTDKHRSRPGHDRAEHRQHDQAQAAGTGRSTTAKEGNMRWRRHKHKWGLWMHDVTPVPLYKYTMEDGSQQVGVEHKAIAGPDYRKCETCPAMERRVLNG